MADDRKDLLPTKRLASTTVSDDARATFEDAQVVAHVPDRPDHIAHGIKSGSLRVQTGKPKRLHKTAQMQMRMANCFGGSMGTGIGTGLGTGFGGSSMGMGLGGGPTVLDGGGGNFYSPELSTDFLELPQSLHELWNYYRFFYRTEPFVGQAIDLHTEIPLSKVRLGMPQARNRKLAEMSLRFCTKWVKRIGLLHHMIGWLHEYNLIGEVYIFAEDANPEMPEDVRYELIREINDATESIVEKKVLRPDADRRAADWMRRNYKGWTDIQVLPPENIHKEEFNFTKRKLFELVPDSKSKDIVQKALAGDPDAQYIVEDMMPDVVKAIVEGTNVRLNTDPYAGGFLSNLSRKRSPYARFGQSILERVLRILVFRDKLRQANTSIASRHMTPIRIVFAEDMDTLDVETLRDQVDMALMDPDFSIIANFEIRWEEMGSDQRLLDLSGEYDLTDRQMYAGLGVTESLLSGESSYSGDRINLEVINTRYMLLREILQEFVEEQLLKPMCWRMGFIEEDEDGEEVVIYPSLTFTRMALRDNADTFDHMMNLYQKGSLDVDVILELLNIDPVATREKLQRDLWTLNDATMNEALRSVYSEAGRALVEGSDVVDIIAKKLGLKYEKPTEEGGRF